MLVKNMVVGGSGGSDILGGRGGHDINYGWPPEKLAT